jgi:hypothetical protein
VLAIFTLQTLYLAKLFDQLEQLSCDGSPPTPCCIANELLQSTMMPAADPRFCYLSPGFMIGCVPFSCFLLCTVACQLEETDCKYTHKHHTAMRTEAGQKVHRTASQRSRTLLLFQLIDTALKGALLPAQ